MARAFIASVPLAVVLIAAVVVPVAVIPGSFGFQGWPSAAEHQIAERRVDQAPRPVKVVQVGPADSPNASITGHGTKSAPAPHESGRAPVASGGTTSPRRRSADLVATAPGRDASGRHGSGRGPGQGASQQGPGAPNTPASEPESPQQNGNAGGSSGNPSGSGDQVAGGDSPVLRDDHPETPAAPASPVQPVAPAPAAPAPSGNDCGPGNGNGNGHGNGQSNGRGHGVVGDVVHGLGLGRGRHLGVGHDD